MKLILSLGKEISFYEGRMTAMAYWSGGFANASARCSRCLLPVAYELEIAYQPRSAGAVPSHCPASLYEQVLVKRYMAIALLILSNPGIRG